MLDEAIPVVFGLGGVQGDFQEASPARHRHLDGQKKTTKNSEVYTYIKNKNISCEPQIFVETHT